MSKLEENWQKENIEKTKEVLKDHFERRKQERMFKDMFRDVNRLSCSTLTPIHSGTSWDIDTELSEFYDKLIWDDKIIGDEKIEKKSIFNKIKDVLSSFYWDFRYNLWAFLLKIHIIKK